METKELTDILEGLQTKLTEPGSCTSSKNKQVCKAISKVLEKYKAIDIPEKHKNLYLSLADKGKRLVSQPDKGDKLLKGSKQYLQYLQASIYDFREKLHGLRSYYMCFIITAVLFMALTPQFYGFILPAIFTVPIFSGIRGIRRRSLSALMLSLTVIPMALVSGITWIKYYMLVARPAFYETVAASALQWGVSFSQARYLIVIPSILALFMAIISLLTGFLGYRYRKMFV